MRLLGIGENRERIVIKGSDFDLMQRVAEDFRYYLDEQEFIRNTRVSYSRRQPEIRLGFDPILLTSYDISRQNIASGLTSLNPEISSGTSFKVGEDTYDIIIRNRTNRTEEEEEADKNRDKTVDDLREVRIPSASGGLHRLEDIASVNYGRGRARITRVNQDKQIELFYSFSRDVEESKTSSKATGRISTSWCRAITCLRAWRSRCSTRKTCLPTSSSCCWRRLS